MFRFLICFVCVFVFVLCVVNLVFVLFMSACFVAVVWLCIVVVCCGCFVCFSVVCRLPCSVFFLCLRVCAFGVCWFV